MITLRALRLAEGLSSIQLGRQLDVTHVSILAWERGDYTPNAENAAKLRARFKRPLSELLTDNGETPDSLFASRA
jgi:transcriptional regulator with XRE-family HTH domain